NLKWHYVDLSHVDQLAPIQGTQSPERNADPCGSIDPYETYSGRNLVIAGVVPDADGVW
ncbi:hypothetical protein GW17_00048767, partial [Ensete ventricosum]